MVYHRPCYLVRLPNTVKELLLDMQTKSKQLQWSIMGSAKDVTLTLTWQCRRSGKCRKRTKYDKKEPPDHDFDDWITDSDTSVYPNFSKQLEMMESLSKLASTISNKPKTCSLPTERKLLQATSPGDIDDGYLTEKATPDEMHVYPRVVVRPPFYLPSKETLINGDSHPEPNPPKVHPVPVPLPPPPPVPPREIPQSDQRSVQNSPDDDPRWETENMKEQDPPVYEYPDTDLDMPDRDPWSNSKSSIDQSTDAGNTSIDPLLTPGSDNTENEITRAIKYGKYVKFRESDSSIFIDDVRPFHDGDMSECSDNQELDELLELQELENSPRHKISYIDPDSVENLNKKKKVKRKRSLKNFFSPWHRKQKYDLKKTPKSPKTGRKMISPKPLYSQKNYVRTTAQGNDNGYKKVIEYQQIKTGQKERGGTWDSSLESHELQHSVDKCLHSCDTILSRQAHAPSDL